MSDILSLLSREVERLVNAPYAPSLQDLYSLVQQGKPKVLCAWVAQKPCQIGALVDVLVDGLSRSRFALPLLASFALAQEFRDSLLQRYPHLLDHFLRQSVEGSETERPQYLEVCIHLLSSPLPCSMIAPASLAQFVLQMIKRMRANPCADTVRPLHSISSCLQASGVLFELPHEVMSCFQTELTKTLRNLDDHMGNLLCLATFSRLASTQSGRTEDEVEVPTWQQNIRHFFGPKRGLKTMDLVVLRVILACSSNHGNLTVEQAAESIRLAITICDSVDKAQRESWFGGNSMKVAKLLEKIDRDTINHSVQVLGASFVASLVPFASLPPNLARRSLDCLVSNKASDMLEILPPQLIPRLVMAHATNSERSACGTVLQYIISTLSEGPRGAVDPARLQISKLFLRGLQSLSLHSASTVSEQYGDAINKLLETFPRQPSGLDCHGTIICRDSALKLENELLSDLITFWVGLTLPQPCFMTLSSFMNKSRKLLLLEPECASLQAKPLQLRSGVPYSKIRHDADVPRKDWRSGLRDVITTNAMMTNENIMQTIENICYDLEQRCGNVEAPLRLVEEERNRYRSEAEQSKERSHDLESQLQQASTTISGLQEEMSCLTTRANSATDRVEELSTNLTQVRYELEELRRTSQDTLSTERESFRTRELDIIATLTERDERIDELQEALKCQGEANEELRTKLASVSEESDNSLEKLSTLEHEISALQAEQEQYRESNAQKENTIEQLSTAKEDAENLAQSLQEKLHEEALEAQNLRTALHKTHEESRVKLEELRQESKEQVSRMADEAAERNSEILSLQRTLREARSEATRDLQTKDKRIQHLEKKVQNLREERAAKVREFSEAQQHISRLMGVMGFKPELPGSRSSSKQRPRPSSQNAMMQTQMDSDGTTSQCRDEDFAATSTDLRTPQAGGRSPKRSRINAFPSAQPSPPRSLASSRKSRVTTPQASNRKSRERRPLEEADNNSQPSSQSARDLSRDRCESFRKDQNHLDDIDLDLSLEFSKDFVFTSTSMSEMNGHAQP